MRSKTAVKPVSPPIPTLVRKKIRPLHEETTPLIAAILRSQAVVEFALDGTILGGDTLLV